MTTEYRLLTFEGPGKRPVAGALIGDRVVKVSDLLPGKDHGSVLALLADWERVRKALDRGVAKLRPGRGTPLAKAKLLPPILHPPSIFCAGANYWDHIEEMFEYQRRMTGTAPTMVKQKEPWFFIKTSAHSIVGEGRKVRLPPFSRMMDWEIELGVVIGKPARDVPPARTLDYVAGYVIVNDLSARDYIKREGSPFIFDWFAQKCFDDSCPMGPWLTPAQFVADPMALDLELSINGAVKQRSNTRKMVHGVQEQIAYLSRHLTLRPGDVIATGTPAGVGLPKGEFLKPGDVMRLTIERCGTLTNRCVAG